MQALHTKKRVVAVLCLSICFVCGVCKKSPVWLKDFETLLDNTNQELEEILPFLSESSSEENVYIGLRRLDTSADHMLAALDDFLQRYPGVLKEKLMIGIYLRNKLQRVGKNLNSIVSAGNYWDKKLGHPNEFKMLAQSILRKGNTANQLLQQAIEE